MLFSKNQKNIIARIFLLGCLLLLSSVGYGQYEKEGYTFIQKIKTPRSRKPEVNEMML